MPILGIVENMSGLICPDCGARIDVFLSGGGRALAEERGIPFLGSIPLEPAVVASGETGRPIVIDHAGGGASAAAAFDALARAVLARMGAARGP
jgi:hypothetical protein